MLGRVIGAKLRRSAGEPHSSLIARSLKRARARVWIRAGLTPGSSASWCQPNASGLEGLTSTGWSTVVSGNFALLSLKGLDHLTSVGGILAVTNNTSLADIGALKALSSLGESLDIYNSFAVSQCAVDELRNRLTAGGWDGGGTIHGTVACSGTCNNGICVP
jgi:hypothetical protein